MTSKTGLFELDCNQLFGATTLTPDHVDVSDMAYRSRKIADELRQGNGDEEKLSALERSLLGWVELAEGKTVDELEKNVAILNNGAFFMGSSLLRDMAIRTVCENPVAAQAALRALIRHSEGDVQANALSCLTIAVLAMESEELAYDILATAIDLYPQHALIGLLWMGMEPGNPTPSAEFLSNASDLAWENIY